METARVRVRYLGILRRLAGTEQEELEVRAGATLREVLVEIGHRHGKAFRSHVLQGTGGVADAILVSVDGLVAGDLDRPIRDQSHITVVELSLMVSGGDQSTGTAPVHRRATAGGPQPMTMTEKIIAHAVGRTSVAPGEEVWARVDLAVMHDSSGPRRIGPVLQQLGGRLWDPSRVVLVIDHFTPPATLAHAEILATTRTWAQVHAIRHFYDGRGIMHNLLLEEGLARPGLLIVGADSHTCTAGAVGAVAVGVGATELATVLVTGQIWLQVPWTVLVRFDGSLPPYLTARDLAMAVLRQLGTDSAIYRAVEFAGEAVAGLPLDERAVLTNQAVEMGAKNGIMAPPEGGSGEDGSTLHSDPGATYEAVYACRAEQIPPLVALPPRVDNICPVGEAGTTLLDRAYIGSCAGGKASDLQAAARLLRGRRVRIPLVVTPATQRVVETCLHDGTLQTLVEAGAVIQAPGCGACAGLHSGVLGPMERCVATVTRNSPGRMGHRTAQIYLASPLTVAASAVTGRLTDPRDLL